MGGNSDKTFGVVIIGRNEGDRLRRCLQSINCKRAQIVYVDSASSDLSCKLARSMGASVVNLDMSKPFSAGRARNAGFKRLIGLAPGATSVQFIDGDCELDSGWLARAVEILKDEAKLAALCGLLHEKSPDASIYNRLRDLERTRTIGELGSCGGIFMVRRCAFEDVGGFDASLAAGEEADLCKRLRTRGWNIRRVDTLMCLHDSAILNFRQWWSRQVRVGYTALDASTRISTGSAPVYGDAVKSARVWGLAWPAAIASAGAVGAAAGGPAVSATVIGAGLLALPAESYRIAARASRSGQPLALAAAYGGLTVVSKFAQVVGQWRYVSKNSSELGAPKSHVPIATAAKVDNASTTVTSPSTSEAIATISARTANTKTGTAKAAAKSEAAAKPTRAADDAAWQADKVRYGDNPWLREQSIWAVAVYRFGRRVDNLPAGAKKSLLEKSYWLLYRLTETMIGVSIPKTVEIGGGFRIHHFGGVFVHAKAKIGTNCTMHRGCSLGDGDETGPAPVLEDNVELGAFAQVLGGVTIGKGAKVSALSVVSQDVPCGASATGNPAKILLPKKTTASRSASSTPRKRAATGAGVRSTKKTARKASSGTAAGRRSTSK
jgi:serine acetyltransferase